MTPPKSHFVAILLIISLIVNVQSIRIMDDSDDDCKYRGPCHKREDCFQRCGLKAPSHGALCVPSGVNLERVCCCLY
ncbi:PREDICTED: putative defensin-like protein 270 [Camelina sativa]|uniref:Defensin-like protein 270 n=1 Tax=Camelina sativa TaxID=90675 RepID=A0ABM1QNP7_CAMSA|nr:PREDICTED: putative defensin-like protein 270 [Camelina sativa]